MASTGQDFIMYQGTTRTLRVTVTGTTLASPSPAAVVWKLAGSNGTPLLAKTLAGGGIGNLQAGPPATLDVYLFPSDTATLGPGEYTHELRMTDAASNQDVVMVGTLTLQMSITE